MGGMGEEAATSARARRRKENRSLRMASINFETLRFAPKVPVWSDACAREATRQMMNRVRSSERVEANRAKARRGRIISALAAGGTFASASGAGNAKARRRERRRRQGAVLVDSTRPVQESDLLRGPLLVRRGARRGRPVRANVQLPGTYSRGMTDAERRSLAQQSAAAEEQARIDANVKAWRSMGLTQSAMDSLLAQGAAARARRRREREEEIMSGRT
jgi:hypothetical protein